MSETTRLTTRTEWLHTAGQLERRFNVHDLDGNYPEFVALNPQPSYDYKRPEYAVYDTVRYMQSLEPAERQKMEHFAELGEEIGEMVVAGTIELSPETIKQFGAPVMRFLQARQPDVAESSEGIFSLAQQASTLLREKIQEHAAELPGGLSQRLDDAGDSTGVRTGDVAVMDGKHATYSPHDNIITIGSEATGEQAIEMIVHERIHQLAGGTYHRKTRGNSQRTHRARSGLSEEAKDPYSPRRYERVDEAVTQHITEGLLYGDLAMVSPQKRKDNESIPTVSPVYELYREVLAEFIEQSDGVVTIKHFIDAYFEDNDGASQTDARRLLVTAASATYGPGAMRTLESACQLAATQGLEAAREAIMQKKRHPAINPQQ